MCRSMYFSNFKDLYWLFVDLDTIVMVSMNFVKDFQGLDFQFPVSNEIIG